jgi:sugar phosphate permease
MTTPSDISKHKSSLRDLPRNVWAVSLTSFFMDISSEMVINILPLYLVNVLGVGTNVIGLIEGIAESTASLIKLFSGWISDQLRARKWLAVTGYAISALTKPFFYIASTWQGIAVVRWTDRVGKGIRTAPRDALIADSVTKKQRGLAFGLQRAADTAGAMLGILFTLGMVWWVQSNVVELGVSTFRTIVLVSIIPAGLAVLTLAIGAKDIPVSDKREIPNNHAGSIQPGIHPGLYTCWFTVRPPGAQKNNHRRLVNLRRRLPWIRISRRDLATMGPIRQLWFVLRIGIRYIQSHGR